MPKEIICKGWRKIVKNTVFGNLVNNYPLRIYPHVDDCHVEYFKLRIPKDNTINQYHFKELYKLCCAQLGYEHPIITGFLSFFIFSCTFMRAIATILIYSIVLLGY